MRKGTGRRGSYSFITQMKGKGVPRGRNRMSTAMGRRGKMVTAVLTGNPGSPGMPSGPCDTTKKKQVF